MAEEATDSSSGRDTCVWATEPGREGERSGGWWGRPPAAPPCCPQSFREWYALVVRLLTKSVFLNWAFL